MKDLNGHMVNSPLGHSPQIKRAYVKLKNYERMVSLS